MAPLLNSFAPSSSRIVGGQFNTVPPAPADGQFLPVQLDDEGNLLVNVVNVVKSSTASLPLQQSVGASSSFILASNSNRKECIVTNTGTTVVFLGLGQVPTVTAYHIALASCSAANDGTGGVYVSDIWIGVINAITASSGTVCVCELT